MTAPAHFRSDIHSELVLDRGRVFAWTVACDAMPADLVARLGGILNRGEIARAAQFRFAADHTSFVVAHAVPRLMLAALQHPALQHPALQHPALQHRPASQWDLESDAAGRPLLRCLETHDTLGVSLSHTRGLAACMVGLRHDVGIDVEACDLATPDDMLPAWLSAEEQGVLARLAPGDRADATVRLWTLKEALAKAVGRGLSLPFGDIRFSIDPPRLVSAPRACRGRWRFAQWRPTPAHMLSVAVRCKGRQPVEIAFEHVSPQTLGTLAEGWPHPR